MRVLVVEDEPMLALDLENELLAAGFEVAGVATTVEQGIQKAQSLTVDVAVVDLNPVAAALRARRTSFLFGSGYRPDARPPGYEDVPMLANPYDSQCWASALSA